VATDAANPASAIIEGMNPLLQIANHHVPACGEPPAIGTDDPDVYVGYFAGPPSNQWPRGRQWTFFYDRRTKKAELRGGAANWSSVYTLQDNGLVPELMLGFKNRDTSLPGVTRSPLWPLEFEELLWLSASWDAATGLAWGTRTWSRRGSMLEWRDKRDARTRDEDARRLHLWSLRLACNDKTHDYGVGEAFNDRVYEASRMQDRRSKSENKKQRKRKRYGSGRGDSETGVVGEKMEENSRNARHGAGGALLQ
jgi:hypothetical protein